MYNIFGVLQNFVYFNYLKLTQIKFVKKIYQWTYLFSNKMIRLVGYKITTG